MSGGSDDGKAAYLLEQAAVLGFDGSTWVSSAAGVETSLPSRGVGALVLSLFVAQPWGAWYDSHRREPVRWCFVSVTHVATGKGVNPPHPKRALVPSDQRSPDVQYPATVAGVALAERRRGALLEQLASYPDEEQALRAALTLEREPGCSGAGDREIMCVLRAHAAEWRAEVTALLAAGSYLGISAARERAGELTRERFFWYGAGQVAS